MQLYLLQKGMCLSTFSRLARSLATIYTFARVRIFGMSVPFYVTENSYEFPVTQKRTAAHRSLCKGNGPFQLQVVFIDTIHRRQLSLSTALP